MVASWRVPNGVRHRVIKDFGKGHTPSTNPYWFDLRMFLILRPSQDYPRVKISPIMKVPRVEFLQVTPLGTIMMCLGVWLMLMGVLMSISRGGREKLNSALPGPSGR